MNQRARDELITQLKQAPLGRSDGGLEEAIADFILARDRKIVEPLLKAWNYNPSGGNKGIQGTTSMKNLRDLCLRCIGETLKNAGVDV